MGTIGFAIVRGDSMLPTLRPGDRLVVRYGGRIRSGGLVLAKFPDGALVVKRATDRRRTRTGAPAWWLASDNPTQGVDSRHRGPIAESDILGVIKIRLWPRPMLLRVPRDVEHSSRHDR